MPGDSGAAAELARQLSDPTRLAVLEYLATEGSSGVSEMAERLDLAGPRLSNHLARLRRAQLVTVEREGRHAIYSLVSPRIKELLAGLRAAVDGSEQVELAGVPSVLSPLTLARSCYDHVAGRLGVALLDTFQDRGVLLPAKGVRATIELGPAANEVLSRIGVEPTQVSGKRRRYAFACMDWTERRAHLGGALGGAVLAALLDQGWVARESGTRALRVTAKGRGALKREFNIKL